MRKFIVTLVAGIALCAVSQRSHADLVSSSFSLVVSGSPDFPGISGTGTVSYDDALVTGVGTEILTVADGLTLDMTIFGQDFTELNDANFSVGPTLTFIDGWMDRLDFTFSEVGPNPVAINQSGILSISGSSSFRLAKPPYLRNMNIEVTTGTVPEPASALLLIMGGLTSLGYSTRGRKRSRLSHTDSE